MSPTHQLHLLAGALCFTVCSAMAQDSVIGYVKTTQANASLVMGSEQVPAEPGMPLMRGHVLKTGNPGSMGVTLKDNTQLSIGPDTELALDSYAYAPGKGDLKLNLNIFKGSLYYVSGVIARLKPEAVSIKIPTGLIGVRGTRFLAKVDPQDQE